MKPSRQHSFLYILRAGGEPGEYECVGESNSIFPMLWRILLADQALLSGPGIEHVIDAASCKFVAVDAVAALSRSNQVIERLLAADVIDEVQGLRRYLHATRRHLEQLLQVWQLPGESPPALLATLDEMPVASVEAEHASWCDEWRRVEAALLGPDPNVLLNVLFGTDARFSWREWRAWSGVFGFALFMPAYFATAFRAPLLHDYQHVPRSTVLGDKYEVFTDNHRAGVREIATAQVVLAPTYERIAAAGTNGLVWLHHESKVGLAQLDGAHAQVLCQPSFDDASDFVCSRAVVMQDDHYGFIDEQGRLIVRPQFDEVDDFGACGVARVRRKHGWGLIGLDGTPVVKPVFDELRWMPDVTGWLATAQNKAVLFHGDGREWIAGRFSEIDVAVPERSFRVTRNGRVGLVDWTGATVLACEFDSIEPIEVSDATERFATYFVVRKAARVGLMDSKGIEILPCVYESIEPLEPHIEPGCRADRPELLRVYARQKRARPQAGLWNLRTGGWLVACEYDIVWLLAAAPDDHRFIVAKRSFDHQAETLRYAMGLLNADGTPWIALEYEWIGDSVALTRRGARDYVREAIHFAWSRGRPVQATLLADSTSVWLYADGTRTALESSSAIVGHDDWRTCW